MSKLSQIRILTVDDEPDMAQLLALMLKREYRDVIMASNGQTGIQKALEEKPDIIVTDLMMPEVDGFTLIRKVLAENIRIPIIVVTAYASVDTAIQALRLGAFDFLTKPLDTQVVKETVARAVQKRIADRRAYWRQEITAAVSASRNLSQIVQTLLSLTAKALGAEYGMVWWPDDFAPDAFLNPNDSNLRDFAVNWARKIGLADTAREKASIQSISANTKQTYSGSLIGLPLTAHNVTHCVLILSHPETNYFDDLDVSFLNTLMPFISLAVDNAKIYTNLRAANQRLSTLQSINALTYNANLPLNRILRLTVEGIRQNLGYSIAFIVLPEKNSSYLAIRAAAGSMDKFLQRKGDTPTRRIAFPISDSKNPFTLPYNTKKVQDLPVENWANALRQAEAPEMAGALEKQTVSRCLSFPIWQGENVIGVLVIGHNYPRALPVSESTLLGTLANQIALVVTNTFLYQAEQQGRREMSALYEAGLSITSSLARDEVLKRIIQHIVDLTNIQSCIISHWNAAKDCVVVDLYLRQTGGGLYEAEAPGTTYPLNERLSVKTTLQNQEATIVHRNDPQLSPAERDWMDQVQAKQRLVLPLIIRDKSIGVVELVSNLEEDTFSDKVIRIAQGLVAQASIAIENARLHEYEIKRLEHEMDLAQRIQISLLPHETPNIPGLSIAARSVSARLVGGDFYRYLSLPNNQFGVVIGDVSGKGVPSALFMAITITAMDNQIRQHTSPGEMLHQLNHALYPRMQENGMNTGLLVAIFDLPHNNLEIANAGMIAPLVKHKSELNWLDVSGFPVGAVAKTHYYNETVSLSSDTTIILASDGVIEAKNPDDEMFGFERFQHTARQSLQHTSTEQILEHIWQDVTGFIQNAEQHDDMTLIIIQTDVTTHPHVISTRNEEKSSPFNVYWT